MKYSKCTHVCKATLTHLRDVVYSLDQSCQPKVRVLEILHDSEEVEVGQWLLHQLVLCA